MGLDTFASRSPGEIELTEEDERAFAAVELCGGIVSDGSTSIRGKIYHELVFDYSEVSLYQEWISPDVVRAISRALDAHTPEALAHRWDELEPDRGEHSSEETAQLQRFFHICAERGIGLVGWW